ncbi:protein giant-like isoform X2 [Acanthaster planci]|nr:protein giant-like isoform X2 [Acanthaster planci]XP_022087869.1 protein giant-like isoform X2 [Acanthaster planci]
MAAVSPLPQITALDLSTKTCDQQSNLAFVQRHRGKPVQRVHPSDHYLGTQTVSAGAAGQSLDLTGLHMPELIVPRKQREFTPEELKDMRYWDRRRKNNDAARRSRQKRRLTDVVLEAQVLKLAEENDNLKAELQAMKEQICQIDSAKSAIKGAVGVTQQPTDFIPKNEEVKMALDNRMDPYYLKPSAFETQTSQFRPYPMTSIVASLPAASLSSVGVPPPVSYAPVIPPFAQSSWSPLQPPSSNGEPWHLDKIHDHLQRTLQVLTAKKDELKQANPVLFQEKVKAQLPTESSLSCEPRREESTSKLSATATDSHTPASPPNRGDPSKTKEKPLSPPSPHSAFVPGVELSKLPHKLRGKMKRPLPQSDEAAQGPDADSECLTSHKIARRSTSPEADPSASVAKTTGDEIRATRLALDSYTPPPSSGSSCEGNTSPFNANCLFDFSAKSDCLPKVSDDLTLSDAHERMVQAAHALAALNKGAAEGSTYGASAASGRHPHQSFMGEKEKYWDKRRRNNQAAKKCRDAKRLLIEYRAARSAYLELENDQLRRETSVLQREVAQLKELVRKRAGGPTTEKISVK